MQQKHGKQTQVTPLTQAFCSGEELGGRATMSASDCTWYLVTSRSFLTSEA